MRQRNNMQVWTPAELAIYNAMQEVEKMGADISLTNAVTKLSEAQNHVADFLDKLNSEQGVQECDANTLNQGSEPMAQNKSAEGQQLTELLHDAINQIEYLHQKFQETGSGNNVIARLKTALERVQ